MLRSACAFLSLATLSAAAPADEPRPGLDWPQFRGIAASGISEGSALPLEWSVETGEHIAWKTPVAGLAHSSPIVWGDAVFVTSAVPAGGESELKVGLYGAGDSADDMVEHAWKLICLDKATGAPRWERVCRQGVPRFKRHTKATHCNGTPATDGRRVVALFGSEGLYAFSMEGEPLWTADLGALDVGPHNAPELEWGFASSPILVEDRVVVQCDVKDKPFLAAFDAKDGRELWRVPRDDVPGWCTPTALRAPDGWQVLMNGCKHIGAVALSDGRELWRMSGGGGIPVPTPVVSEGRVFLTSNHQPIRDTDPLKPIFVVSAAARGAVELPPKDASSDAVAWWKSARGNYMQTPLIYRGVAYFCADNGIVTAFDEKSGEQLFRQRLTSSGAGFTASGVAGDGKVYSTSEEGDVHVLEAGREFKPIAQPALGEICMSTPAISQGRMIFRTRGHVICVGK